MLLQRLVPNARSCRSTSATVDATLPLVRQLRGLVGTNELRGLSKDLRTATPPLASLAKTAVPLLGELRTLGSCANEVLVPFGNSTLTDPNFPAKGRVFEELPKSLVGLAGESRSGDANGQWFKVLGTGGLETVTLGNGLFGSVGAAFEGVNPPATPKVPELNADAPCENQEIPDLRTIAGQAPATVADGKGTPKVLERTAKAQATAVEVLRDQLKAEGKKIDVLDKAATREQLLGGLKALRAAGK